MRRKIASAILSSLTLVCLAAGSVSAQPPEAEGPLVQVLIYGLGAFQVSGTAPNLELFVYLPERGTPDKHDVAFWYGVTDGFGGHKWKKSHNLGRHTVTFPDLKGQLEIHGPGTATGKPSSPADAAGVKWMAKYHELDEGPHNIEPANANVHLELRVGRLETCALVHDPGKKFRICDLQFKGANGQNLRRAFSEYMVLRHPLSAGTTEITVLATPLSGRILKQVVPVHKDTAHYVDWDDGGGVKRYRKFIDVLFANLPTSTEREMESGHANHLKGSGSLFPGAVRDWSARAPECSKNSGVWVCDSRCVDLKQPPCWDYFKTYPNFPSGLDRPICPFVEFP